MTVDYGGLTQSSSKLAYFCFRIACPESLW
jgi:hypothetical protein